MTDTKAIAEAYKALVRETLRPTPGGHLVRPEWVKRNVRSDLPRVAVKELTR